jgi:hypothetical protein
MAIIEAAKVFIIDAQFIGRIEVCEKKELVIKTGTTELVINYLTHSY